MRVAAKPGTTVDVTINGVAHQTIVDKGKTQRFVSPDDFIQKLIGVGAIDLDAVFSGKLDDDTVREFLRRSGRSICSYSEFFADDIIENPLEKD